MIVKLLTEHHLEFLSLTGGCGGSSESTLVKMSNCWKSQSTAHIIILCARIKVNQPALLIFPIKMVAKLVLHNETRTKHRTAQTLEQK